MIWYTELAFANFQSDKDTSNIDVIYSYGRCYVLNCVLSLQKIKLKS